MKRRTDITSVVAGTASLTRPSGYRGLPTKLATPDEGQRCRKLRMQRVVERQTNRQHTNMFARHGFAE